MVSGRRPPPSRWETLEIDHRPEQSRRTVNAIYPLPADTPTTTVPRVGGREPAKSDKWIPWLIPLFVIANSAVFVITMYVNDCPKKSVSCIARFLGRLSFQPFKENPLLGPSSTTLQKMGALDVNKVVRSHEAWRLLSCNWLHAGVFHLLANMLSLLAIGIRLEQEFGFARVSVVYIVSGFGGSLMSSLFIQKNISVGASGSLFGLLGAMLSELITNWSIYVNKVATLSVLVIIIAINLSVGILPHVDNFAHIGGFLSGFLMGFVLLIRPQYGWRQSRGKSKYKAYQCVLWVMSVALLVAWLTLALVAILRGVNGNDHCKWCHYLSCVPTSKWTCINQPSTCLTIRSPDQLNVTCIANGRSHLYINTNVTDSQIQNICSLLCT